MKALDRKLLRDLGQLKGQVLTIALVVAVGIAGYVSLASTYGSLIGSRDAYYAASRFADVFGQVQGAPRWALERLREVPGVSAVEGRLTGEFRVEVPGFPEPVRGHFVSLPDPPRLNLLTILEGRLPQADDEVVLSELFARAHGLRPGGRVVAVLNGRRTELRVSGVGVSPEYVWLMPDIALMGDNRRYGVLWMREPLLAAALRQEGRFNDVALSLAPGASADAVVEAVDRALAPWGSAAVFDQSRQASNRLISQELQQLETSQTAIPVLFLGVAVFLLNVMLSRVVASQREQIATLKALGYSRGRLGGHYVLLSLVVVGLGAAAGAALGAWAGGAFLRLYADYFQFPQLRFELDLRAFAVGAGLSAATAVLGAWGTVRRVLRLAPAEAMRPEAPTSFRPTAVERRGLDRWIPVSARMVLRELERHPVRTALSALGVALATAILVVGNMGMDSVDRVFAIQFERAERADLTVSFDGALPVTAVEEIARLPGVLRAEPRRTVPVRLRSGAASRETTVLGMPASRELQDVVDVSGRSPPLPAGGLLLSSVLADRLGVKAGDEVEVEVLEAERRHLRFPVAGVLEDAVGIQAYARLEVLEKLLDESPRANAVLLRIDRRELDSLSRALVAFPRVTGVARRELAREHLREQIAESFLSSLFVLVGIAAAIAVGVVYNNARIALALRGRDLATLRILGFQRSEVASILMGEQAVQLAVGIPLGLPLGHWMGAAMYSLTEAELFRLPILSSPRTLATAAIVVVISGAASAWLVARRAKNLDLVSVLKARD